MPILLPVGVLHENIFHHMKLNEAWPYWIFLFQTSLPSLQERVHRSGFPTGSRRGATDGPWANPARKGLFCLGVFGMHDWGGEFYNFCVSASPHLYNLYNTLPCLFFLFNLVAFCALQLVCFFFLFFAFPIKFFASPPFTVCLCASCCVVAFVVVVV